jgi:hypothetical protein
MIDVGVASSGRVQSFFFFGFSAPAFARRRERGEDGNQAICRLQGRRTGGSQTRPTLPPANGGEQQATGWQLGAELVLVSALWRLESVPVAHRLDSTGPAGGAHPSEGR